MCFLNTIIFQNYKSFLFIDSFLIIFLFFLINYLKNTSIKKSSDNIINNSKNTQKENFNSVSDGGNNEDSDKLKKILKIILYISLFFFGGIFLYYTYMSFLPVPFTVENALEQLKMLLPEEKYNQVYVVVLEMMDRPDKLGAGIQLLHIIKTLLKEDFPTNFEKIMDDIISYFEGKK